MGIKTTSYKNIVKSTAVFGGAQLVQMLITILRAKFIAIFLGSYGMGINAILQSTVALISSFSSLGIFQSAVRDISQSYEEGDRYKLSKITYVFNRVVLLSGVLGTLLCIVVSPWLSKLAFENNDYLWHFLVLSFALLFTALANGKVVFLQGTRNLASLAKASLLGAFLSLIISIPLFYLLEVWGIVLSIVLSSLLLYIVQAFYTRKIKLTEIQPLTVRETIKEAEPMIKLGSVLMMGTVLMTGFTYLTNIFIGRFGVIDDVGFFQGVSSITNQSIAVIIAVLASDFFPRLSAVYKDRDKITTMVNQQSELISIIIAPIIVVLIVFAPFIIKILLSNEFLVVTPMLRWMALSLIVRGIWLTMSYIILAKGDRRAYFIYDALIGNGLLFLLNITAYSFWGLQGLGISFLIGSIMVSLILYLVVRSKYGFVFSFEFRKIFGILSILVISSFLIILFLNGWIQYVSSAVIMILIFVYCLNILNNRMGIFQLVKLKFRELRKSK